MKSESFYLIPTLFLFSIVLIKSWQDFDYINRIRFNLESGEIQIESRNILKKIFRTSIQKSFDSYRFAPEIKFKVRDSEGWMSYSRRYYVDLEISDNKKIRLIGFSDEKEAYNVSLFFDSLSKTRQHNR